MTRTTKEFDLIFGPSRQNPVRITQTTEGELASFYPKMDDAFMHRLAPLKTCERIRRCNPDNMWTIHDAKSQSTLGLYANIMLSNAGHKALLDGSFKASAPSAIHTATQSDPVGAIYTWAVLAPGRAVLAIPLIAEKLKSPKYANINIYGNGMTNAGKRIMEALGFRQIQSSGHTALYMYLRLANRKQKLKSPNSMKECNNV